MSAIKNIFNPSIVEVEDINMYEVVSVLDAKQRFQMMAKYLAYIATYN